MTRKISFSLALLWLITVAAYAQPRSGQPVDRVVQAPTTCTTNVSVPVSYNGKIYNCVAGTYTASDTGGVTDATATVAGKAKLGQLPTSTYAGLPACAAGNDGQMYRVTDANRDVYSCYGTSGKWVSRNGGVYNVRDFGAVGDGSSHLLSATFASVAAAAAVYPTVGTVWETSITAPGSGYVSAPTISFSGGGGTGAAATAYIADGGVTAVAITGAGAGYTLPPIVTFSGGGGSGARAEAIMSGGTVASIRIINPGTGYTSAPTVAIDAPETGTATTGTLSVSGGAVTAIPIAYRGGGYTSVPSVSISGDGSGATAHATIAHGAVTAIIIDAGGTGYTSATATIAAPSGYSTATATATVNGVWDIKITNRGSGYTSAPTMSFSSGSAAATAVVTGLSDQLDWAAAQLASDSLDATNGGKLYFPSGNYQINKPVHLPYDVAGAYGFARVHIRGDGARLTASSGYPILSRIYHGNSPTELGYLIAQGSDWSVEGITFYGTQTAGQIGFAGDGFYNLTLRNNYYYALDIGADIGFGLMTSIENSRFIGNLSHSFRLRIPRATAHIDHSLSGNSSTERGNRHYASDGQVAPVKLESSAGFRSVGSIYEGENPIYNIWNDGLNSNAVNMRQSDTHVENLPLAAHARLTLAGTAIFEGLFLQSASHEYNLVETREMTSGEVVIRDMEYLPSGIKNYAASQTYPHWRFENLGAVDWRQSSRWRSSVPNTIEQKYSVSGPFTVGDTDILAARYFRLRGEGAAGNYFKLTGTPTAAARTITFPDAAITVARSDAAQTFTGAQTFTNIGIGTTSPAYAIDVAGTVRVTSQLLFGGTAGVAGGPWSVFNNSGTYNITENGVADGRFTIKAGGNVGINTSAADKQLEINSPTGATLRHTYNDNNGGAATYVDEAVSSGGAFTVTPSGGVINLAGALVMSSTPQTLTDAGAVNLTTYSTLVVTTGAAAQTLAAGAEGQQKFIRCKTYGGDATITVTNLQGGTTIKFTAAGQFVYLLYQDGKWNILTNSGATVA